MQLKFIQKLIDLLDGQTICRVKEILEFLIDLKLVVDFFVQLVNISCKGSIQLSLIINRCDFSELPMDLRKC
jgi:hypothetical protein